METVEERAGGVAEVAEPARQMSEAAERARRMAAEELATVLAHDLRNPLTAARGQIQLVRRSSERQERLKDAALATAALEALDRIGQMIADLLDISRLDRGTFAVDPRPTELVHLVRAAVATFRTARREVRLDAPAVPVPVLVDPERIRQAVENLIRNGIQHADEDTPVVVAVGSGPWLGSSRAYVAVSNEGPEIPPGLGLRLFDPFAAGRGSVGLGLGLYIASRIAAVHGGELAVDPGAVRGACFRLSLPVDTRTEQMEVFRGRICRSKK